MSAVSTSRAKKINPLSKKVPENPKFRHVKATVDTGASITRYMRKLEEIKENYKFRKDEIFKRMKSSTFVQLVIQVGRIQYSDPGLDIIPETPLSGRTDLCDQTLTEPEKQNDIDTDRTSPVPSLALTEGDFNGEAPPESGRSTLLSVARGVGELDVNKPGTPGLPPVQDCPYLLLDVRTVDDYNQKNKTGRIIVMYDDDERLGVAPQCVTTLVERGYDNVFMLSGGLKVAARLFPEGLITGSIPAWLRQEQEDPRQRKVKQVKQEQLPAKQTGFTQDDLDRLEMYLETVLQDNSVGSRMSKASTASSRLSTARSVMSNASSRPAFR